MSTRGVGSGIVIYKTAGYDAAKAVDIDDAAQATLLAVVSEASQHVLSGNYMAGIRRSTERVLGVVHHVVMVQDENVYAIEWGHYVWGAFDSDRRVPGQFVLTNAYRAMAGI